MGELGGNVYWEEARPWLKNVSKMFNFDTIVVNQQLLDDINKREQERQLAKIPIPLSGWSATTFSIVKISFLLMTKNGLVGLSIKIEATTKSGGLPGPKATQVNQEN